MLPSPRLRCSPRTEPRKGSSHRRGQSLESRLPLKAKDDDLVLFNEMQKHEADNFLLHTSNDFDYSISKFTHTSDLMLGITVPARGENSDLLNTGGDKNDYDWLLTPPDTPLFPSLDDDEPQPFNSSRGRRRTQPISILRPYMNEKTQRKSRSSASPYRLSLSPQSSYGAVQTAARPSSAPRSCPSPVLRQTTPLRRPSTPTKPSTPNPRSPTPTSRRMRTGQSGQALCYSSRGSSLVKANYGHSESPNLRGWQSNLTGSTLDAQANLQTSLPDRSTSRVRGLSPSSGSSMDSSSKFGMHSMSPSASRSASSSHSLERHQFIALSKAASAYSGDDGADSVLSVSVGVSDNSAVRKYGAFTNKKSMISNKKTSRLPSPSSGPRRSLDSVVRQIDHQKAPLNMFRPLLSSVPATTFYAGKTNTVQETMFYKNWSETISSNASTKNYASGEEDNNDQYDLASESEKIKGPEIQEEVLVFCKLDERIEDNGHGTFAGTLQSGTKDFDIGMANEVEIQEIESSSGDIGDAVNNAPDLQSSHIAECSGINCNNIFVSCLKCGKHILIMDVDGHKDVCEECAASKKLLDSREQGVSQGSKLHLQIGVAEHPEQNSSELILGQLESNNKQEVNFSDNCPSQLVIDIGCNKHLSEQAMDILMDTGDQQLPEQLKVNLVEESAAEATGRYTPQQLNRTADSSLTFGSPEGTGISVLLMQRSRSIKWPVVRTFSTTSIICSEPSYARENFCGMTCSIGRESSSASSSIDLGSSGRTDVASRKTDYCVLHQIGSRKDKVDNIRSNCSMNIESNDSYSEASVSVTEASAQASNEHEKVFSRIIKSGEDTQGTLVDTAKLVKTYEETNLSIAEDISIEKAFIGQDTSVCTGTSVASDTSFTQLLNPKFCFQLHGTPAQDYLYDANCTLSKKSNEALLQNDRMGILDVELEVPINTPDSSFTEDNHMLNDIRCQDDILDVTTNSFANLNLEQQIDHCFQDTQNENAHIETPNYVDNSKAGCLLIISDKNILVSASESNCAEHPPSIEAPRRSTQRTFTLEEATDTVLFCSSIVHDLAYKAATVGMEKEIAPSEASCPMITCLEKSISNQKDVGNIPNKHTQKSRKVNRKKLEIDTKKPPMDLGNDVKTVDIQTVISSNIEVSQTVDTMKPPKLESKCNCTVM